jgi:Fur family peroxide stress response transcriptional regulator
MEQLSTTLKESGFKLTPQRLSIARYLEGNTSHPTAARIYEDLKPDFPSMSMATVYNTLNMMTELGLVKEYNLHKDQVHFDPDTNPHYHFCCTQCQAIIDIPETTAIKSFKNFELQTNNRVDHVSMVLSGVCKNCLEQE